VHQSNKMAWKDHQCFTRKEKTYLIEVWIFYPVGNLRKHAF
jgi:hypothetical protein